MTKNKIVLAIFAAFSLTACASAPEVTDPFKDFSGERIAINSNYDAERPPDKTSSATLESLALLADSLKSLSAEIKDLKNQSRSQSEQVSEKSPQITQNTNKPREPDAIISNSAAGGQLSSSTPLMLVDPVPVRAAAADGVILTPKVQPGWQGTGNYVRGDQIAALQKNLAAMSANKAMDGNYAHAKATCTAKLAEWTYREVNTKGATEHLYHSALLLQDAAKRGAAISFATPPIAGVDRAYTDVWKIIDKLHAQPGARCAQVELACAAVNLQGAEYEAAEGYGKHQDHGRYFLGEVNKLLMSSQKQIAACPPLTPPVPPVVQQVTPKQVKYTTQAKVLFAFDSAVLSTDGRDAIKSLAADMANRFRNVNSVQVVGYTDLLGSSEYNTVLSNKRARAVATELVSTPGFRGDIDAVGRGAQNQVKQCEGTLVRGKAPQSLKDCLEPNRRVEIIVNGEVK